LLISRRREAKRRALLQMLDRLPIRTMQPVPTRQPAVPTTDIPLTATPVQPRATK
jgi:hypothetical protein